MRTRSSDRARSGPVMWALHFILPGGAILPTVRSSIADEEHPDEIRDPSQRGWQVLVEGRGQQQRDHGCLPDDGAEAVVPRLDRHGAARGREGGDSRQDRRAQQLTPGRNQLRPPGERARNRAEAGLQSDIGSILIIAAFRTCSIPWCRAGRARLDTDLWRVTPSADAGVVLQIELN